jgi:predicted PurR-regulated permease PerM
MRHRARRASAARRAVKMLVVLVVLALVVALALNSSVQDGLRQLFDRVTNRRGTQGWEHSSEMRPTAAPRIVRTFSH